MDIVGMLYPTGRIGTTNYILTPENIVNDMINMLPDDFWTPDVKVLDIFSKSGRFLMAAYKKLFNSPYLADMDIAKRKNHILNEQIYGLTDDFTCLMLSERMLYGYAQYGKKNIRMIEDLQSIVKTTDKKLVAERLGKVLGGQMKFDLVIGNPPYNNDLYLDFVTVAQHLSSKYTVMITPAKWQAKGGKKNEDFRKNVVPYMSKIVYYPYTKDVFAVTVGGGITYYVINTNRNLDAQQLLELKSIDPKVIFKNEIIYVNRYRKTYFNDIYENIVSKVIDKRKQLTIGDYEEAPYYVEVSHLSADKDKSNCMGGLVTTPFYKSKSISNIQNIHTIFSGTEEQCDSFISFVNTKTVRFLIMLSLYVPITNNICWRFVPAPKAFDHIFTDQELYEEYNLTAEEINIVESVIKERK